MSGNNTQKCLSFVISAVDLGVNSGQIRLGISSSQEVNRVASQGAVAMQTCRVFHRDLDEREMKSFLGVTQNVHRLIVSCSGDSLDFDSSSEPNQTNQTPCLIQT